MLFVKKKANIFFAKEQTGNHTIGHKILIGCTDQMVMD